MIENIRRFSSDSMNIRFLSLGDEGETQVALSKFQMTGLGQRERFMATAWNCRVLKGRERRASRREHSDLVSPEKPAGGIKDRFEVVVECSDETQ